jgi:hypothetical protein
MRFGSRRRPDEWEKSDAASSSVIWFQQGDNLMKEYMLLYHILAKDLNEAVAIAERNPEFEYGTTARVEFRPIKMMEESTGYAYPRDAG